MIQCRSQNQLIRFTVESRLGPEEDRILI